MSSPSFARSGWINRVLGRWRSTPEVRLSTTLDADEVLARMRQASLRPAFFRLTGPAQSVVGRFQGRRFSLVAAQAIRHTQARHFYGEVLSIDAGTLVQGRFKRRRALWIAESVLASIFLLGSVLTSIRAGDPKPAAIVLLAIVGLALITRHQLLRTAPLEDDVRSFLARVTDPAAEP